MQRRSPGFKTDLFTLYGWLSAELFSQALKNAGSNPSRGSLLQALSKITSFSGDNIIAPNNPAARTVGELLPARPGGQRAVRSGRTIRRSTAAPRVPLRLHVHDAAGVLSGRGRTGGC